MGNKDYLDKKYQKGQRIYEISEREIENFENFRKVLHCKVRSNYKDPFYKGVINNEQLF